MAARRQIETGGLFPSEPEIAERLCQKPKAWSALAEVLEREGLPRIDPLFGGRYWPAVRAFMDRRSGLLRASHAPSGPDGEETWQ